VSSADHCATVTQRKKTVLHHRHSGEGWNDGDVSRDFFAKGMTRFETTSMPNVSSLFQSKRDTLSATNTQRHHATF